jgi:hypothetical protein
MKSILSHSNVFLLFKMDIHADIETCQLPTQDHFESTPASSVTKSETKLVSAFQNGPIDPLSLDEIKADSPEKTLEVARLPKLFANQLKKSEYKTNPNGQAWFSGANSNSVCPESSVSKKEFKIVKIVNTSLFSQSISRISSNNANVSIENDSNEKSEIVAAARSLKTNILLTSAFILIFVCLAFLSDYYNVLICSTLKGMVPILTTIANFGKIQTVLLLYCQNAKNQLNTIWTILQNR